MTIPLYRLATALISPAIFAWVNTIDNSFGERFKGEVTFLISLSKLLQFIVVLPLLLIFRPDLDISLPMAGLIAMIALLEYAYVYPYFWALRHTDTSIVAALFSLGKIIIPVLAWFFLHERLAIGQYGGFGLILVASVMLTFSLKNVHLNKAALWMLLASLLLSLAALLNKYVLMQGLRWDTVALWTIIMDGVIGTGLLAITPRKTAAILRKVDRKTRALFLISAGLCTVGNASAVWAFSLMPISIANALGCTQQIFVALYAKALHPVWPRYFKERSTSIHPLLKTAGLILTAIGAILAAG